MPDKTIEFSERLGFSSLFQDYVYHPERVAPFFAQDTLERTAERVLSLAYDREALVDILTRQNRSWGAPGDVLASIARLRQPKAVAVMTGQQAGLFGGPYLVVLKMLAAVKAARQMEQRLSIPVVPIFWIAADDHDFKEVSLVDLFDQSGRLCRLAIDCDDDREYPPVGMMSYDASLQEAIDRLKALLPDNDFKEIALGRIEAAYQIGRPIADCFAQYLLGLLGRFGIVLFNPNDREFKGQVSPLLQDIVKRHQPIKEVLRQTGEALRAAGYHLQVQKSEGAAHLFRHDPERRAIRHADDVFAVGRQRLAAGELIALIAGQPHQFSPDVLTRPLMQSVFFPTVAVIAGPAEVAYFAQLMPLYDLLGLIRPHVFPRPSMTLIESRFQKLMDRYRIGLPELTIDLEATINRLMQDSFPDDLEQVMRKYSASIGDGLQEVKERLTSFDPSLSGMVNQTGERIEYLFKELHKKLFAAHKKRNAEDRDKLYRAQQQLFPNLGLAERSIAAVYFVSRYGEAIFDCIYENLQPGETGHQLLLLTECNGQA